MAMQDQLKKNFWRTQLLVTHFWLTAMDLSDGKLMQIQQMKNLNLCWTALNYCSRTHTGLLGKTITEAQTIDDTQNNNKKNGLFEICYLLWLSCSALFTVFALTIIFKHKDALWKGSLRSPLLLIGRDLLSNLALTNSKTARELWKYMCIFRARKLTACNV